MEAVWQFDWEQVEIDPRGSFFSTNDAASDDGDKIFLSYGRRLDDNTRPLGVGGDAHAWIPRTANVAPEDETSQAGVAFRYFAESLNSTEFGLYYVNYHSRTPNISAVRGQASNIGNTAEGGLNPNPPPLCMDDAVTDPSTCRASYFVEYDEDISLWGLSMNTNGPWGTAVQGEVSYRPNAPVQLSGGDVVPAALVDGMYLGTYAAGEVVSGYDEIETWQIQTTITKAFGPSFGAGQWIVLGEIGYTRQDLEDKPYSGAGAALPTCRNNPVLVIAVANGSCQEDLGGGFQTKSSWGYRLVTRLDYSNVFASVNISPRLVFFHDVNGVSSTFTEDNQVISAGVQFSYLQRWQADIAYTVFTGGEVYAGTDPYAPGDMTPIGTTATGDPSQSASFATRANDSADRDFLGVSVSYAF